MKELAEIERVYIKDIIEFFCRKSFEIFGISSIKPFKTNGFKVSDEKKIPILSIATVLKSAKFT